MNENLSMDEQFLDLINKITEKNLDNENFSVEDLAEGVGLSRSMLHRKLMKLTGKSASEYITEKRLQRAKEWLEHDMATASEIAYNVGFKNPSYFNKVFKKHFGLSPGEVRKKSKIDTALSDRNGHEQVKNSFANGAVSKLQRKMLIILLVIALVGTGIYLLMHNYRNNELSIAVLPLENLTGEDENKYLAIGIQDELITELSKLKKLRVIWNSYIHYRSYVYYKTGETEIALSFKNAIDEKAKTK